MESDIKFQVGEIREHIFSKATQENIDLEPFPHAIIDNFFPANFARKIDALFPPIDSVHFDDSSINNTLRRYRRSMFSTDAGKTTVEHILDDVFDEILLKHILNIFNIEYSTDYGWGGHYVWDFNVEGCNALQPHVDIESKVVSFVYYIPVINYINGKITVQTIPGTNLLIKNNDNTFTTHKKVEAKRNRCIIFPRVENSWHAVDETIHPRRTITVFIVKKSTNTTFKCLK